MEGGKRFKGGIGMSAKKYTLNKQEKAIMRLVAQGMDNKQIAKELYVSHHTVKSHIAIILKKLNATNRTHATYLSLKFRLIR